MRYGLNASYSITHSLIRRITQIPSLIHWFSSSSSSQVLLNFVIKNVAGVLLSLFQRQVAYVVAHPLDCKHAIKIRWECSIIENGTYLARQHYFHFTYTSFLYITVYKHPSLSLEASTKTASTLYCMLPYYNLILLADLLTYTYINPHFSSTSSHSSDHLLGRIARFMRVGSCRNCECTATGNSQILNQ